MREWEGKESSLFHSADLGQGALLRMDFKVFLNEAGVSADELAKWHARKWLSFQPLDSICDMGNVVEVRFLATLTRSFLNDAQITWLLAKLERPYCYEPSSAYYSFSKQEWVRLSEPPEFGISSDLDDYLDRLAAEEEWDDLRAISRKISQLLEQEAPDQKADEPA